MFLQASPVSQNALGTCFEAVVLPKRPLSILGSGASGGGGGGGDSIIKDTMADLLDRLPENFEMITMQLRAKPLLEGEAGPFVVVALQVNLERNREGIVRRCLCVETQHFWSLIHAVEFRPGRLEKNS